MHIRTPHGTYIQSLVIVLNYVTLPHRRKKPKRLDDGASPHTYETPKDRHCYMYFEVTELYS